MWNRILITILWILENKINLQFLTQQEIFYLDEKKKYIDYIAGGGKYIVDYEH